MVCLAKSSMVFVFFPIFHKPFNLSFRNNSHKAAREINRHRGSRQDYEDGEDFQSRGIDRVHFFIAHAENGDLHHVQGIQQAPP